MTYILVLCLACAAGGNTITVPRLTLQACEADAARFRASPATVAECIENPDPRAVELRQATEEYCRLVAGWKRPDNPAYSELPKTYGECMARMAQ